MAETPALTAGELVGDPGEGGRELADLAAAAQVTYQVRQRFRYTYDGSATDLAHRLVVVPPRRHGGQLLRSADLRVSAADARTTWQRGPDGLRVATVRVDVVPPLLDFDVTVVVDRIARAGWPALPASALSSRRLLAPTDLTTPTPAMSAAARSLAGDDPIATARRLCGWVHQRITYVSGSTSVATTAAEALAGGRGVCQDQAHVMIALCRAVGIPARYVSGHMLGEGDSHAWVEVVVPAGRAPAVAGPLPPDPYAAAAFATDRFAADRIATDRFATDRFATDRFATDRSAADAGHAGHAGGSGAVAVAFDPCHDRMADLRYVTVAAGRDYHDVAPTSGSYVGMGRGTLVATQRVDVVAVAGGARRAVRTTGGHSL